MALLGRPRSAEAANAHEAGPPTRWAILGLGSVVVLIGLVPGAVLALAEPALRVLANADMAERSGILAVMPQNRNAGYAPLGVAVLLALATTLILAVLRARAVAGHRTGPAWDCGFGAAPAWLPHGDKLTQYGGGSFAQPLRRALGTVLLGAKVQVDMPEPGDLRPATFTEQMQDPSEAYLFAPAARLRARLSSFADQMQFLTARQSLAVIFAALVTFLGLIALLEQL